MAIYFLVAVAITDSLGIGIQECTWAEILFITIPLYGGIIFWLRFGFGITLIWQALLYAEIRIGGWMLNNRYGDHYIWLILGFLFACYLTRPRNKTWPFW